MKKRISKKRSKDREYLFVDAYNIINSWESLKTLGEIDLEEARYELLEILAEYHYFTDIEVIAVFDAHMVKGNSGNEEDYKGIKVVFTKENQTADHYIEKEVDSLGRIKRIRVATSDWLEQQIILSRGGTRISARELEIEIRGLKLMASKKTRDSKHKNDLHLGRLDDHSIEKLNNWKKGLK